MGVTDRPDIGGNGCNVGVRQFGAALRRHRAGIVARVRHAFGYSLADCSETAVAEYPLAGSQVGTDRRPPCVGAVTPAAGTATDLAVEDAVTQRDLSLRRA